MTVFPAKIASLFFEKNITFFGSKALCVLSSKIPNYVTSHHYSTEESKAAPSYKIETQFGFEKVDSGKKQEKGISYINHNNYNLV